MYYILFFLQYKHIRETTGVPRQPYEVRFISCDGHQLYDFKERGVDLDVHALFRDASQAAYILDPPPSRDGDLELEGGVNVSLRKYGVVHGTLTWYCV